MQELIMMEMASQQQQQQPKKALWATAIDHKGRTYYYNRVTRESRWSLPEEYEKQQEKNNINDIVGHHQFGAAKRNKEKSIYEEALFTTNSFETKSNNNNKVVRESYSTNEDDEEDYYQDKFEDESSDLIVNETKFDRSNDNKNIINDGDDDRGEAKTVETVKPKLNLLKKKVKKIATPRIHRGSNNNDIAIANEQQTSLRDRTNHQNEKKNSKKIVKQHKDKVVKKPSSNISRKKQPKWKQQSNSLRMAMMAAKGKMCLPAGDGMVQVSDDGLVPCPHCNRRFNQKAAERHIPKCKDIKAKPRTLRRGAGTGAGAGAFKNPLSITKEQSSSSSNSTNNSEMSSMEFTNTGSSSASATTTTTTNSNSNHSNNVENRRPATTVHAKREKQVKKMQQRPKSTKASSSISNRKSVSDPTRGGINQQKMECPHCNRIFSRRAGLRHIEKCKEIQAKPAPIRRTKTIHFKQAKGSMKRDISAVAPRVDTNNYVSNAASNTKKPYTAPVVMNHSSRRRNQAWEEEVVMPQHAPVFRQQNKIHSDDRININAAEGRYGFTQEWFEDGHPDAVAARFDLINNNSNSNSNHRQRSYEEPTGRSRYNNTQNHNKNSRRRPASAHHANNNNKQSLGNTMEINRLEEELAELDHLLYEKRSRR